MVHTESDGLASPESDQPESDQLHEATSFPGLRVVIAHEWITVPGGSEQVVQSLCSMFPDASIVTSVLRPEMADELFAGVPVRALWTSHLPGVRDRYRYYAPVLLAGWAAAKVGKADLLISSNHFGAIGAGRRFRGPHLSYVHTPLRLAWRPDVEALRLPGPLGVLGRASGPLLRRVDRSAARSVDVFAANSREVAARIDRAYGRKATVIAPPVRLNRFLTRPRRPDDYLLVFGRLIPYKRVDLAVQAANALGARLIVAGAGSDASRLKTLAGPTVEFCGRVTDDEYGELLAGARALLFPGEEDFGIVPVEALAAGCPVVAFGRGGVLDTVIDGGNGVLFPEQSVESLVAAIRRAEHQNWVEGDLRASAMSFSPEAFQHSMGALVRTLVNP